MTTPSGQISLSQVNTELGISPASTLITMNQANVRALAGVPSGAITMANLQNKSNTFNATISSPQQDLNLITYLTPLGYTPGGAASIIIAPGVYIWASSTANAGLTIPSAFGAGNLTLTNNGFIMGKGGTGTRGPSFVAGTAGGPAMSISTPIILTNNSYIAGGGGGGGGSTPGNACVGGGGAGGGDGGAYADPINTRPGGAGGGIGASGGSGGVNPAPVSISAFQAGGGGGGRILPGTGGAGATVPTPGQGGGAGGGGGAQSVRVPPIPMFNLGRVYGGGGGGWGAAGGTGQLTQGTPPQGSTNPGPGGSSNAAGGNATLPGGTGPVVTSNSYTGGKAINLNGNSITYPATGTIWGAVS